jgi:hypothetical protein
MLRRAQPSAQPSAQRFTSLLNKAPISKADLTADLTHKDILETLTNSMLSKEQIAQINIPPARKKGGEKGGKKSGQKGGVTYDELEKEHKTLIIEMNKYIYSLNTQQKKKEDDDKQKNMAERYDKYARALNDVNNDDKIKVRNFLEEIIDDTIFDFTSRNRKVVIDGIGFVKKILETLRDKTIENESNKKLEIPIQEVLCEQLNEYSTDTALGLKINEKEYVIPYNNECKDIISEITSMHKIYFIGSNIHNNKIKNIINELSNKYIKEFMNICDKMKKRVAQEKIRVAEEIQEEVVDLRGGDYSAFRDDMKEELKLEKHKSINDALNTDISNFIKENAKKINESLQPTADILYDTIKIINEFNTKFISYSNTTEHELNLRDILNLFIETTAIIMAQQTKITINKQATELSHTKNVDLVRRTMTFMILIVLLYLFVGAFSTSSFAVRAVKGLLGAVTPDSVKFITMLGIVVSFLGIASQSEVVLKPLAESVVFSTAVGTKLITSAPKAVSNAPTTVRTAIDSATEKLYNTYNYFFVNNIIKPINENTANTENVSSNTVSVINENTNYTEIIPEIIPENLTLSQSEKNVMEIIAKLQNKIPRELSTQAEEKLGEYKAAIEAAEKTIQNLQLTPISNDPVIRINNIKKLTQIANSLSNLNNNNTTKTGGGRFISPEYIVLVVHTLTKIKKKDTSINANKECDDLIKLAEILDNVEKDKQQGKFSLEYLYILMENIITTVEQTEKKLQIRHGGGNKVRRYKKTIKKHNYKKKLSKKRSRK